jgi:hypothetical protein
MAAKLVKTKSPGIYPRGGRADRGRGLEIGVIRDRQPRTYESSKPVVQVVPSPSSGRISLGRMETTRT